MSDLLATPLMQWHIDAGAKMAPFGGWNMPIQYEGIIIEHQHTRTQAGIFDICHMGEFFLKGQGAKNALAKLVTHDLETLKPQRCRYGFLLNPKGGVLDDLIVYCLGEDDYMLVVNASTCPRDFEVLSAGLKAPLEFVNRSSEIGKIDLQGPKSIDVAEQLLNMPLRDLPYFANRKITWNGHDVLISRTGYTGELGYEFYLPWTATEDMWKALLKNPLVKPVGLGARDTLRLEVGLPLYGHEMDEDHNPTEAGYDMMLKSEANYCGKGFDREVREKLIALNMEGRRAARQGDPVLLNGQEVGRVTSGSFGPSVGQAIALAYVKAAVAEGTEFEIKGALALLKATRTDLPFYKNGTARVKLS